MMKLCVACKWFEPEVRGCGHPKAVQRHVNPVDGAVIERWLSADAHRMMLERLLADGTYDYCGLAGRLWEPAEP